MANPLEHRVPQKAVSLVSLVTMLIFLPLLLLVTYQAVQLMTRALGTSANIRVDAKATLEPLNTNFFHAFAQGGEEATDMLAPVTGEVRTLRPKVIRIDHLYDIYVNVSRQGGSLSFDWSKLDTAIDTILATGAKPTIALSYMPPAIARDGVMTNPPTNWDEWAYVVQKTIEHVSGRSGKNLAGIYYEVWNEPNLRQFGGWGLSGDKNYLTLYRYASQGAANAANVNGFFLGGPATSELNKNWIIALATSGYRLNFFSWHSYLSNPAQFGIDQRNLTTWLLPYPNVTLIPKLITEFGFTGDKDVRYGTTYASAFTAAAIRQLISGGPQYLFSFELKDGPNDQQGNGWGLITHENNGKKPKPRYYVFNFLDTMAGTRRALTGEGSWVTGFASERSGVLRLMLVNFDSSGNHVENVPVTFANLDPGIYLWRERFLFGRDVSFTQTAAADSTISRQVYMPAQSVAIIELTRR